MKKFYQELSTNKKVQMASAQIPWSHNMLILDKVKNEDERLWYIQIGMNLKDIVKPMGE